jgi:hypothetical protein
MQQQERSRRDGVLLSCMSRYRYWSGIQFKSLGITLRSHRRGADRECRKRRKCRREPLGRNRSAFRSLLRREVRSHDQAAGRANRRRRVFAAKVRSRRSKTLDLKLSKLAMPTKQLRSSKQVRTFVSSLPIAKCPVPWMG